jgi:RNA polymerase sigma-70 factor (ECF subfamily)
LEISEIIEGCYKNSRKHQEALYNLYAAKMLGVCLTYTSDRELAQDILHDGFFKVFKKFDQYNAEWNLFSWIRRIIVNTAIDHFRKTNRISNVDFQENEYIGGSFDDVSESYKTADLSQLINMLPTGARTVFNLYVVEGYKHHEIAEMLHISDGKSKSKLSKAKSVLKELVNKYYVR